jgi:hypothetical protein
VSGFFYLKSSPADFFPLIILERECKRGVRGEKERNINVREAY